MGFRDREWAAQQPVTRPLDRAVLLAIADYHSPKRGCWPTIRKLCEATGYCERAVRYALRRLEASALIATEKRITKRGDQTSNVYRILRDFRNDRAPGKIADDSAPPPGTTCPTKFNQKPEPVPPTPVEPGRAVAGPSQGETTFPVGGYTRTRTRLRTREGDAMRLLHRLALDPSQPIKGRRA
jgi:hypothetical protein